MLTTPHNLPTSLIDSYQLNGFVHIPSVISPEEAARFRVAALECQERVKSLTAGSIAEGVFNQLLNVWRVHPVMKELTLHPNVGAVAEKLATVPLRLWHDHLLIKKPHNKMATEFHQDHPYWPLDNAPNCLSAWIALQDVPVERGCMTFINGSHRLTNLASQDLMDRRDIFRKAPEFVWYPRTTVPLRAGDCTFHHGYCAHMATPNETDEFRVAHVVIFMDAAARYARRADGNAHPVSDPLNLAAGAAMDDEIFPRVSC